MTTPSIRALRHRFPQAKIVFLTESAGRQILENNPFLDEILIYPHAGDLIQKIKFILELRRYQWDIVIDFMGNPRSAFTSWITGAPQRIGFDFRGRRLFYNHVVSWPIIPRYAPQHKGLLLKALGIELESLSLDFPVTPADQFVAKKILDGLGVDSHDRVVSLSPVSRQPYKVWPAENFAQLADWMVETYSVQILFVYGPGEESFVEKTRNLMKHQALANYLPPSLSETRALFGKMILHVGNDNGPAHFAIAAAIPTVIIFGKPRAVNWTPPHSSQNLAVEYDPGCKQQCVYPRCPHLNCIRQVPLEAVREAVKAQFIRINNRN